MSGPVVSLAARVARYALTARRRRYEPVPSQLASCGHSVGTSAHVRPPRTQDGLVVPAFPWVRTFCPLGGVVRLLPLLLLADPGIRGGGILRSGVPAPATAAYTGLCDPCGQREPTARHALGAQGAPARFGGRCPVQQRVSADSETPRRPVASKTTVQTPARARSRAYVVLSAPHGATLSSAEVSEPESAPKPSCWASSVHLILGVSFRAASRLEFMAADLDGLTSDPPHGGIFSKSPWLPTVGFSLLGTFSS